MGSRALTLILNANHSKKSTVLLPAEASDVQGRILREARNKFRSKALSQVFLQGGAPLGPDDDLPPGAAQVWVAKGEAYAGPPAPAAGSKGAVRVLAREAYVDDGALKQLDALAVAPGVLHAVGMSDLHPGSRFPIGCAVAATGVYPALVGSDVGCGVALFFLAPRRTASAARLAARLVGLDAPWATAGDRRAWLARFGVDHSLTEDGDAQLGTVGAGNHFAELCDVDELLQPVPDHPELQPGALCLLVHSGSRGLGAAILAAQTAGGDANPLLEPGTSACDAYLAQHDAAVRWARANRALIAHRVRACLVAGDADELRLVADVTHNAVERCTLGGVELWVHRKGAAPTTVASGLVPCPGSRGAFSYLLAPTGDGEQNAHSLAHGAGRRHPRSKMHEGSPPLPSTLSTTALGSEVVCADRALLLEERPEAYKDIGAVVRDMETLGVARPVVRLRPVVSYKVREGARGAV